MKFPIFKTHKPKVSVYRRPLKMLEKIDIIDRCENGETQTSVAKSYNRNQSTIGTVISQKSLILTRWETQSVD